MLQCLSGLGGGLITAGIINAPNAYLKANYPESVTIVRALLGVFILLGLAIGPLMLALLVGERRNDSGPDTGANTGADGGQNDNEWTGVLPVRYVFTLSTAFVIGELLAIKLGKPSPA